MNAWVGKILRVNLTKGATSVEELNEEFARDYIGGRGLGVKYLYDEIDHKDWLRFPDSARRATRLRKASSRNRYDYADPGDRPRHR